MIILFTDFGFSGPYVGQLHLALLQHKVTCQIVNLMADAPIFNPRAASYLLPAYTKHLTKGDVVLAVVDPTVGTDQREGVVIVADDVFYVGPGNGLFTPLCQQATKVSAFKIVWQPEALSATFHARDFFAPIAAQLSMGELPSTSLVAINPLDMPQLGPDDLAEIIYIDAYGNLVTGLRGQSFPVDAVISINEILLHHANTYAAVESGQAFWYVNSSGLIEIAANSARASDFLSVTIGQRVDVSF